MMQEFVKSQKLGKWLKWMQTIQDEIIPLLSDVKVFWEVQDIIRQNPHIQKPSYFYRYLERSYISHALVGLRRQIIVKFRINETLQRGEDTILASGGGALVY